MNVIFNADDFGTTKELNNCVQSLHAKGIIMSASIIANSEWFDHAVNIARSNSKLGIGIHFCLDGLYNMTNGKSSLINPENGQFYDNIQVVKKLKRNSFNSKDIFREYDLQAQKVLDNGIKITHFDHHHHHHLYFQSFRQLIKISKKYNIKCIRSQKNLISNKSNFLNQIYRNFHQHISKCYMKVPDGYFALLDVGTNSPDLNLLKIRTLLTGSYNTIEIECHPRHEEHHDTLMLLDPNFINLFKQHTITNFKVL
jgi:chitin disaccharide deacetylase